jgi:hypothetical protein
LHILSRLRRCTDAFRPPTDRDWTDKGAELQNPKENPTRIPCRVVSSIGSWKREGGPAGWLFRHGVIPVESPMSCARFLFHRRVPVGSIGHSKDKGPASRGHFGSRTTEGRLQKKRKRGDREKGTQEYPL